MVARPKAEEPTPKPTQTPPGPRTEGGAPVGRPGSVYPKAVGSSRGGVTVVELPERDSAVLVERAAVGSPSYIGSGDLYGRVSDPMSGYWVESLSGTDATSLWATLPEDTRIQIDNIAKMKWPTATGEGLWEKAVKGSAASTRRGQPMTAFDWIGEYSAGLVGNETGASGVGRGPRSTFTMASERDLRSTADAIGAEVLGRAITDEEFQKVLRRVRTVEQAEPTVTRRTGAGTVTESGLTAEGRKDLITEMLMKGPEAKEFAQATTMMDAFYQALSEGPRGS